MPQKKIKNVELAKVGIHGERGQVVTEAILQDVEGTFEGSAPITLGHTMAKILDFLPPDAMPKLGSVVSPVSYANGTLLGDVLLTEALQEAFQEGYYDKWSQSLF